MRDCGWFAAALAGLLMLEDRPTDELPRVRFRGDRSLEGVSSDAQGLDRRGQIDNLPW